MMARGQDGAVIFEQFSFTAVMCWAKTAGFAHDARGKMTR
jgi:hypothetical protein